MKTTSSTSKVMRFDFFPDKADDINDIPYTIVPQAAYKPKGEYVGLICRWRINALNKANDEVLGFLYDTETVVWEFETKETDLPVLIKFASDSFMNVELAFQDKLRLPYNIFGKTRPSFDKIGQSLLDQLTEAGYYS